jgi:hypothetical protein
MRVVSLLLLPALLAGLAPNAVAGDDLTMSEKAEVFAVDMRERFVYEGQLAPKLREHEVGREFVSFNIPDNAYMTGIRLATLSLQYAVTGDPVVKAEAGDALRGLNLVCTVSGIPGLAARATWIKGQPTGDDGDWQPSPDGVHIWRADVSSDQVDGILYGYAVAYDLVADDAQKKVIAKNVSAIVDHILANDRRIVDYHGKPTMWGKYYKEYVARRENMNALLLLQHLKVAHHVSGEERFAQAYRAIAIDDGYARIAVTARRLADPLGASGVNHSDDVLLFQAYYPLMSYEQDPELRALYLKSLRRAWEGNDRYPGIQPEGNSLFAFMAHKFLGDDSGVKAGVENLRVFPLDMKWNARTIWAYQKRFDFRFDRNPVSSAPRPGDAVPVDRRRKQWSVWVHTPYEAGERPLDHSMEFNGHDYLWPYWLGRYLGLIDADA